MALNEKWLKSTPSWHCTGDLSWLVTRRRARASPNGSTYRAKIWCV